VSRIPKSRKLSHLGRERASFRGFSFPAETRRTLPLLRNGDSFRRALGALSRRKTGRSRRERPTAFIKRPRPRAGAIKTGAESTNNPLRNHNVNSTQFVNTKRRAGRLSQ
jgi:hypothetical protein